MKLFNFVCALTVLIVFTNSNMIAASDNKNTHASVNYDEMIKILDAKSSFSPKHTEIILAKDSDRGCCIYKTEKKTKCNYTNELNCYEGEGAKLINDKPDFRKNQSCRELPECK